MLTKQYIFITMMYIYKYNKMFKMLKVNLEVIIKRLQV